MVEITANDTFNTFKQHKFGYLGGRDFAVSDNGIDWSVINHYTDLSLTNPNTALIGEYYYIVDNNKFWKTKDFNTFIAINTKISDSKYSGLKNFEWFQDENGSWFIKYNATAPNKAVYTYFADFDETTDSFINTFNQFNLPIGESSGLTKVRGSYYIWQSGDKLYQASNFRDNFTQKATDIKGDASHKQFSADVSDNYLYVYFIDNQKTYMRSSKATNLIHWSIPVEVSDVAMGSYFYNAKAVTVLPDHKKETTFDKVLKVTANGFKQTLPISCFVPASLQEQWEQNSSWQISFTAYDDKSMSYAMLSEEADVEFNGQHFIIKQAAEDANGGIDTKQITASHIYNEISRVRQRKTKTGTLTYSVKDVLSFYLDDKVANPLGFTYQVYGDFDKQQIQDFGNSSGQDMLSKIIEQWPKAIIYPNNKKIGVYTPEAFAKNYGKRIDYLNNSSEVKMTVDSTTITNQVKVFGKQVENTDDNASDNAPIKYYFDPFIVQDDASIKRYGLHPMDDISDERFTDKNKMQTYAEGQLSPNSAVSIEITCTDNQMPYAGEQRHLIAKPLNLETDLTIIGYTWTPFDESQKTSLSFANLPASILNTQSNINNRIRMVQLMAQQAINSARTATTNYVSLTDPMQVEANEVRSGDIWTMPLLSVGTKSLIDIQDDSDTNQTIYTDPDNMEKVGVQLSIWNGSKWLEIGNQHTVNEIAEQNGKNIEHIKEVKDTINDAMDLMAEKEKELNQHGIDISKIQEDISQAQQDIETSRQDMDNQLADIRDSVVKDVADAKAQSKDALDKANGVDDKASQALENATEAKETATTVATDMDTVKGEISSKADKSTVDTINQTVSDQGTKITQNANDIKSKASSSDVNKLKGTVETNETLLLQTAQGLTGKADTTQLNKLSGDLTTLSNNFSTTSAGFNASLSKIDDKVNSNKEETDSALSVVKADIKATADELSSNYTKTNDMKSWTNTQIKQRADEINSTVTSVSNKVDDVKGTLDSKADKASVDAVTKRVTSAESSIIQNANNIKSKVSSSDVQGMLDNGGYATQTWTGSQIDQRADEISSTVTSVSNKVDNLQIGGRNLLVNTADSGVGFITIQGDSSTPQIYGAMTRTSSYIEMTSNGEIEMFYRFCYPDSSMHNLKPGQTYIIQGEVYVSKGSVHFRSQYRTNGGWINYPGCESGDLATNTSGFVKVKYTFTIPSNATAFYLSWQVYDYDSSTVFRFRRTKLEVGRVATDWTPAPEDMATVTALSKVDQKADSISTTVTNNKSDADTKFSNIKQTIGGIQSTVASKADASQITQLSNQINLKVDTSDYNTAMGNKADKANLVSQINIDKSGVLIQGKHIMLDGDTIIKNGIIKSAMIDTLDVDKITGNRANFIQAGFNGINSNITIGSDAIHFKQGNGGMDFTSKGMNFYDIINGEHVGSQGPNNWENATQYNGINTRLDPEGDFMGWSVKKKEGQGYEQQLVWYGDTFANYLKKNRGWNFYTNVTFLDDIFLNTKALFFGNRDTAPFVWGDSDGINIRDSKNTTELINIKDSGDMYTHFGTMVNQGSGGVYRVNDKNNANTFAVETNGSKKVWFGGQYSDGGGSLYSGDNNGWWMRNHDGSYGNVNAKAFIQKSTIDLKKNIEMADTDKLANDIYNMDVTLWNYKEETSQNAKHIGAVIGGDYHINSCLLSDDKAGVNTTSLTFALVAALQKQAKQISELLATVETLKIKNGD